MGDSIKECMGYVLPAIEQGLCRDDTVATKNAISFEPRGLASMLRGEEAVRFSEPERNSGGWTMGPRMLRGSRRPASVPDCEARRFQLARAVVADEVVPRADVVDAQAIGARVPLANVALEHVGVVNDVVALAVLEATLGDGLPTRLTTAWWLHRRARLDECEAARGAAFTIA